MIGAPNTQGQTYWVGIVQWAPETSVSEEIADIFRNYNMDENGLMCVICHIQKLYELDAKSSTVGLYFISWSF